MSRYRPDTADPATAPFWIGTRGGELRVERCAACGYLRWPPGRYCPECLHSEAEWIPIAPTGTVWSYTAYHRSFDPAFADLVPYTVAFVEMDDGPRMYGLVPRDASPLAIGTRVQALFDPVDDEVTLVRFAPLDELASTDDLVSTDQED